MRNRFRLLFPFLAVLLLAPWPIAYAYDNAAGDEPARIIAVEPEAGPSGLVFGRARGNIKAGDLFIVDATTGTRDFTVIMNLTNVPELARFLSYLTLKVGVNYERDGQWKKAPGVDGALLPETFITMQNAEVAFNLPKGSKYKISIDSGSFYCYISNAKAVVASPRFYLTLK